MNGRNRLVSNLAAFLVAAGGSVLLASEASSSPDNQTSTRSPTHETWVLDQVIYPTQKDSGLLAEITQTHSMDALIAVLSNHQVQFQRQESRVDTAELPSDIYATIAALPAGEPFIAVDGGRSIANSIIRHEPPSTTSQPN